MRRAPCRLLRAPSHLWLPRAPARPPGGQSQPRLLRSPGPLTLLCRRRLRSTFRFLQTAPVRTNFPSEVAFFCLLLLSLLRFACLLPFFFFSSSFAATTTLIEAYPQSPALAKRAQARRPPGARSGCGWQGRIAEAQSRSQGAKSSGERLAAGSRAREAERRILPGYHLPGEEEADKRAPEQFIGTQGTEEGEPLWHLFAASALFIPLRESLALL